MGKSGLSHFVGYFLGEGDKSWVGTGFGIDIFWLRVRDFRVEFGLWKRK